MGVYLARNGRWSYLNCNFLNHRAAVLKVLGVPEERNAVAKAVAPWDGLELEEAIIAAKGAGCMARTSKEWVQHPQAAAIAALPLLEIVKIGEARSEPLPKGERPLSGVRVLDLTCLLAGPTCARTLAEHGADVLKITARHLPNLGFQEWDTGHGKLSAELDLREPANVENGTRPRGGRVLTGLSPRHSCGARPRTRAIGGNATRRARRRCGGGLGRRRVPRISSRADQDAGVTLRVTGARHERSPGRSGAGGSRFILPRATRGSKLVGCTSSRGAANTDMLDLWCRFWNLMNCAP